jgi:hypothetical protein
MPVKALVVLILIHCLFQKFQQHNTESGTIRSEEDARHVALSPLPFPPLLIPHLCPAYPSFFSPILDSLALPHCTIFSLVKSRPIPITGHA